MRSLGWSYTFKAAARILAVLMIFGLGAVGCDSSSNPSNGAGGGVNPQVQVVLNGAGNVATVTYGDKVYTIDTSARPGATIDAASIDVYMLNEFPGRNIPLGYVTPDYMLGFTVKGLNAGETIVVTLTFPTALPNNAWYYKANAVGFFRYLGAAIEGNTVRLTLTDNGPGDNDNIPGQITDPGGPAVIPSPDGPWSYGDNGDILDQNGKVVGKDSGFLSPNRNTFNFGAAGNAQSTNSQQLFLQDIDPDNQHYQGSEWVSQSSGRASLDQIWGDGGTATEVWSNPSESPEGKSTDTISFETPEGDHLFDIEVNMNKMPEGTTMPPFGNLYTPLDGATVQGSVPVTGWVLDDVGAQSVEIWRNSGTGPTYVGDATFVDGARPDIESQYPDYPQSGRAGWGYMLLTNSLPDGSTSLWAVATDVEGNETTLGTKTITVDNANAVKPFGAIDSPPGPCTPLSGQATVLGWVLTPQPNSIPADGSTINVYIDGVNRGNPTYNIYRQDVANLFPGYNNSDGAGFLFQIDTTTYADGIHSIHWTATDDAGNSGGIGSRYFSISNP